MGPGEGSSNLASITSFSLAKTAHGLYQHNVHLQHEYAVFLKIKISPHIYQVIIVFPFSNARVTLGASIYLNSSPH